MKTKVRWRVVLAIGSIIMVLLVVERVVVEAASEEKGAAVKEAWGEVAGGARLCIVVDKNVFSPCEPILVVFKLRAVGVKGVEYIKDAVQEEDYRVTVRDENGKDVPLTRYGAMVRPTFHEGSRSIVTITGNQEATTGYLTVNRSYDMTLSGRYTILVERSVLAAGGSEISLKSGTLEVQVR